MKEKTTKIIKLVIGFVFTMLLVTSICITSFADEPNADQELKLATSYESTENEKEVNIFDEIYTVIETNADKIFSILAFVGTLVVGVGYKSGLLPLLRDALSRLKSSIDGVKADGELNKAMTESKMQDISQAIENINSAIEKSNGELQRIEWQFNNYEELMAERQTMRTILQGQIDMLYAIFMSSALPQYQKDEIGEKIKQMREELISYEEKVEN